LNMSLLSDVNSGMSPNDGDILRWNDSAGEWDSYELPTGAADEKVAVDGSYTANYLINVLGGGVGISLNASSPPTGKLNINWNAALNDLDDVNAGSPLTNQVLTWSGSYWYAKTMSGSATDELVAVDSDDDGGYLENKLTASGGIYAEKIGGTGNKRIDIHLLDKVTTRVDEHSFSILGEITDRDYWGYFVYNDAPVDRFERYYVGAMIKKGPPIGETYTVQIIKSDYNGSNEVIMNSVTVSNFHSVEPSSPILLNRSNMVFLRVSGTSPAQTCEDLVVTIFVETRMV